MGFWRTREDFVCISCQTRVSGDGYTNHCPTCLVSLHVDRDPGDRLEDCRGVMDPVAIEQRGDELAIIHRCQRCGATRRCRTSPADNAGLLLELARRGPWTTEPRKGDGT